MHCLEMNKDRHKIYKFWEFFLAQYSPGAGNYRKGVNKFYPFKSNIRLTFDKSVVTNTQRRNYLFFEGGGGINK